MEIPSSHAGVVKELKVKLGDKIGEGSLILVLETSGEASTPAQTQASAAQAPAQQIAQPAPAAASASTAVPAPAAASFNGQADIECDMMVLGAGPGGYSAAFRADRKSTRLNSSH